MKIAELFRLPIDRRIEEVVKVDLDQATIVADEIDEYVVTDNIAKSFELVLDRYEETIRNPDEGTTVWVSGFFGSGKSSFAKIFGYLVANPALVGQTASERFLARVNSPKIAALLNTTHTLAPTRTVFVDLSTGKNVAKEGESVVLPLYRSLLENLGYSTNALLAELEYDLETDRDLDDFIEAFAKIPGAKGTWHERRNVGLARGEASHAMHLLRPDTYPQADSWGRSAAQPVIDANWFAKRAVALLQRRGDGAIRLMLVVDEVGQYVARSVDRMHDLQGLAEAVQKTRGGLWLMVTSQETLDDVVDSLEGKRIELARVQARFPVRVDLLPADIDEVAGKRVLDKSPVGEAAVRAVLAPHRNRLDANVRLSSPTRGADLAEDEFVRLYPVVPYQIQLLIDAVSARRAQGGATPNLGGSNRTIIKLAQQLVVHPKAGLGESEVGRLVTLDRAYDLLESMVPTSWQAEISQVVVRYGDSSPEAAVAKVIALVVDVPALSLDAGNLAALLHPSIDAESLRGTVDIALEHLVRDEVVRQGDGGYRLQSPQEKDWEKTRRSIEPRPAEIVRMRRPLIAQELRGLSITERRAFKIEVHVDGEKVLDGEVPLHIELAEPARREGVRTSSREPSAAGTVWWVFSESPDTYEAEVELFRSQQMLARRDTAAKGATDIELLGEERSRERNLDRQVVRRLTQDMLAGQLLFHGRSDDVSGTELRTAAQEAVRARVREVYPRLDQFSAPVTRTDVTAMLRADDLRGLPEHLGDAGLGLVRATPEGVVLAADRDPLAAFVAEIRQRTDYGNEATGAHLEQLFGAPPYGAPVEVIQVLAAASIRAGLVEALHQAARITRADDPRLDNVLGKLPAFRSASFRLQLEDVPLDVRHSVAKRLGELLGSNPSPAIDALGPLVRSTFLGDAERCGRVTASLRGVGLRVPMAVGRTAAIAQRLQAADDKDAVRTASEAWADLMEGRRTTVKLDAIVETDLDVLQAARDQLRDGGYGLDQDQRAALQQLQQLLDADDLADHIAKIRSITSQLAEARRVARGAALDRLRQKVNAERLVLEDRFAALEPDLRSEALSALQELVPDVGTDGDTASLDALHARFDAVSARVERARTILEDLSSAGQVAHVKVSALVGEAITSAEELEVALKRIGGAVEAELAVNRQVRLS